MMMNLFSVFDGMGFDLEYGYSSLQHTIVLFWLSWGMVWANKNYFYCLWSYVVFFLANELSSVLHNKKMKSLVLLPMMMFFAIFFTNFYSLFPMTFCVFAQVAYAMIGVLFFLGYSTYSFFNFKKNFLSHLIPYNTPFLLIHFMVIVELISFLIRPLTLAIRLMANLTAGHLILSLISSGIPELAYTWGCLLIFVSIFNVLEVAISIIQGYIYTTLLLLYYNDLSK